MLLEVFFLEKIACLYYSYPLQDVNFGNKAWRQIVRSIASVGSSLLIAKYIDKCTEVAHG
jgi:hypothetical protein